MSGTRGWRIPGGWSAPAPLGAASAEPRSLPLVRPAPEPDDDPVTYSLRGQFRALDGESEPMHTTAITLWECSALCCVGFALFGDRLEQHSNWHRARRRDT